MATRKRSSTGATGSPTRDAASRPANRAKSATAKKSTAKKATAKKAAAKKATAKKAAAKQPSTRSGAAAKRKNPTPGTRIRPEPVTAGRTPTVRAARSTIDFVKLGIDRLISTSDLVAGIARLHPQFLGTPIRRPDDLFVGTLFRDNLTVVRGASPRLEREVAGRAARLILELPPQAFGEEALLDATGPDEPDNNGTAPPPAGAEPMRPLPTARMRMAGTSRLAFTMPANVTSVPYTYDGILEACRTWPMARAVAAQPPARERADGLFTHDAGFLLNFIGTAEFQQSRQVITDALASVGGPMLDRLTRNAADRIAATATQLAAGGAREGADVEMTAKFRAELDTVSARIAVSRDPQVRAMVGTAIGYHASSALAELARVQPDIDISVVFPILPWLIRPQPVPWNVTQLEVPYRLVISPIGDARFEHDTVARAKQGRHELWHTHLTISDDRTGPDRAAKIRAIWSDDYALSDQQRTDATNGNKPFRMPMDPWDRTMLVDLMAGFHRFDPNGRHYLPKPSTASRLHLSALGALLDAEGGWTQRPTTSDVEAWRHLATLGRDHYVRVVYAGFLWPFGHRASLLKVTERKFEPMDGSTSASSRNKRVAVLRQKYFIMVREDTKAYDGSRHVTGGHVFPFSEVQILTRITPNLLPPNSPAVRVTQVLGQPIYDATVPQRMAFWPMVNVGSDFRFELAATDRDGSRSTFSLPLLFIGEIANRTKGPQINAAYAVADAARRTATLNGSSVAFAPVNPSAKGDTRLPTKSVLFTAGDVSRSNTLPNVYPEVEQAEVGIRAIQRLLGKTDAVVRVAYDATYRAGGFGGQNKGEVFLKLVTPWTLGFGGDSNSARTDTLGGLASPGMAIEGLSRIMGPASDLANITGPGGGQPKFDPAAFFKDAKILGGIPLHTLLDIVTGLLGDNVPKLISKSLPATPSLPERVEARFSWSTTITKSDPLNLFVPGANPNKPTTLAMNGVMSAPIADPAASTFEADAKLNDFKVNLFGFIILWFIQLKFDVKRGQKPDVAVDLHPTDGVTFGGPLEFVNTLKDLIPANGFSDPPSLSVTPSGITASYSLSIPSPQVGIFALSNLSIGAGFSLPFDSKPVLVTFNFCSREKPFSLTVSFLGGGGFFALGIGAEGVREIEAAVEFGAAVAINLGVASGSVEVKAGVYFHWITAASGGGVVELTGYIRLHGELSILGLISVSLTFNLQLSYLKEGSRSTVWGEATLTVAIDILFFSFDVSVKCRREFAGSPSDPTFLDLVPDAQSWQQYCLAYGED